MSLTINMTIVTPGHPVVVFRPEPPLANGGYSSWHVEFS